MEKWLWRVILSKQCKANEQSAANWGKRVSLRKKIDAQKAWEERWEGFFRKLKNSKMPVYTGNLKSKHLPRADCILGKDLRQPYTFHFWLISRLSARTSEWPGWAVKECPNRVSLGESVFLSFILSLSLFLLSFILSLFLFISIFISPGIQGNLSQLA